MKKADFIARIAPHSGLNKKESEAALNNVFYCLSEALQARDSLTFSGFGSFKVVPRSPRKGRIPRTGQEIQIPSSKSVKFVHGKALKEKVK